MSDFDEIPKPEREGTPVDALSLLKDEVRMFPTSDEFRLNLTGLHNLYQSTETNTALTFHARIQAHIMDGGKNQLEDLAPNPDFLNGAVLGLYVYTSLLSMYQRPAEDDESQSSAMSETDKLTVIQSISRQKVWWQDVNRGFVAAFGKLPEEMQLAVDECANLVYDDDPINDEDCSDHRKDVFVCGFMLSRAIAKHLKDA